MKNLAFDLIGTSPFLYHKFNIENISNKSRPKSGSAGDNPEEWKTSVWCEGKKLYIPGNYLFSSIQAGGKYVKAGRGNISNRLAGCMRVVTEKFYLNVELPEDIEELSTENFTRDSSRRCYLDIRSVKNPMTKGRNVRYRVALSPGWGTSVEVEWDDTIISKDDMKRAIECAGKFSGVGDGRGIGLGRFDVANIKIT